MKNNNFETVKLDKIKININNDEFWLVPNSFRIFTPKRRDYIIKKAKSLDEIFEGNNLHVGNYYFSFNRDPEFKYFNELQKLSSLKELKIDNKIMKIIEKEKQWFFNYSDSIKLKFDEKNLYKIYRGNSFLINENYFENYVDILKSKGHKKETWIFYWTGSKFELIN